MADPKGHGAEHESRDDAISLREVRTPADSALLSEFYEKVLSDSFSPEELVEPWWDPDAEQDPGDSRTLLALGSDNEVLGGVVVDWFPRSKVLLVSYVAVLRSERNRHVGSKMISWMIENWFGDPDCQLVVVELDDPRHWPSDVQDPVLRLRFYDKFGVKAIARPYFQPPVAEGRPPVFNMFLASFDQNAPAVHGEAVDGTVVREFLEEYLEDSSAKCGNDGEIDSNGQWLLAKYTDRDIPLMSLLDFNELSEATPRNS